jgi:hypothetical protein
MMPQTTKNNYGSFSDENSPKNVNTIRNKRASLRPEMHNTSPVSDHKRSSSLFRAKQYEVIQELTDKNKSLFDQLKVAEQLIKACIDTIGTETDEMELVNKLTSFTHETGALLL